MAVSELPEDFSNNFVYFSGAYSVTTPPLCLAANRYSPPLYDAAGLKNHGKSSAEKISILFDELIVEHWNLKSASPILNVKTSRDFFVNSLRENFVVFEVGLSHLISADPEWIRNTF